jgi:hypothetical protein
MSWLAGLGLIAVYLCWCWWQDRRSGQVNEAQAEQETIDFSIYLYTSKRGQIPRLDR